MVNNLLSELAQLAYDNAVDKEAVEKTIYVCDEVFRDCIKDRNPHHKKCIENKGYLRVYHDSFWTDNPDGKGKTYHHGIVHIVNKDAEVNQEYMISVESTNRESWMKFYELLNTAIKINGHKLLEIENERLDSRTEYMCATLTPQRIDFEN